MKMRLWLGAGLGLGMMCGVAHATGEIQGYFDQASCSQIYGWARAVGSPIPVQVVVTFTRPGDNTQYGYSTVAGQFRGDVQAAGYGDGISGFSIQTPLAFRDGTPYTVVARANEVLLNGSPKTLQCTGSDIVKEEGWIDYINCNGIMGWGWQSNLPLLPAPVTICIDNECTQVLAGDYRGDLLSAGKGNGYHAFTVPLFSNALRDGKPHKVSGSVGDGVPLGNDAGTTTFTCN